MTGVWDGRLVDLAARALGGSVVAASDEFFAPKESLLDPAPPVRRPGEYTWRGQWMDGWETRRRRDSGHDWCIVRLGAPGIVRGVVVDTTHFSGNHPQACSLDGCALEGHPAPEDLADPSVEWVTLLARSSLRGDARNRFPVDAHVRVTHLRLGIHPDGGVARLRVPGEVVPDPHAAAGMPLDLAAVANGAVVTDCSDSTFASHHHLTMPGPPGSMGDGWETRRRRDSGHDWAVVRLMAAGRVRRVEVDTTHYRGNAPTGCSLDACASDDDAPADWWPLLGETRLQPDTRHLFTVDDAPPATRVRLNIFPDGGVARLRLYGALDDEGAVEVGLRWLDALPRGQAESRLLGCCASRRWAAGVAGRRPFHDIARLEQAADAVWSDLGPEDWLEAFAAHPRIGERGSDGWSSSEQAGARDADEATLAALAEANRAYERRFGHVFLVCATGRGAGGMLDELRRRLGNDPPTELRVAAEEQRRITRLRLGRLLRP
ncbi:MAG: allantoicase [Actinobacteria bacterium]|nr:allantoicase [Actinomycetota bacterium]